MSARGRAGILAVVSTVGLAVLLTGAGAWAAVTPPSGPVAGGTSVTVDVPQNRFVQIAHGNYHVLGLTEDGAVWAWGDNFRGQLGDGTAIDSLDLVRVQLPAGVIVTQVVAGGESSFAITDTGALYAWGRNAVGELGDGSTTDRPTPVLVPMPGGVAVASVHTGYDQGTGVLSATTFAITPSGALYGWGANGGKFGDGTAAASGTPVPLALPGGATAVDIVTAQLTAYVLASDGAVYSAGSTTSALLGALGRTGTANVWAPVSTAGVPVGVTFTAVASGRYHGLALGTDGVVYGWGNNADGRLGVGAPSGTYSAPTAAIMPAGVVVAGLFAYNTASYFLASDGGYYVWGDNTFGMYGDGTVDSVTVPTAVALGLPSGIAQLSVGQYTTAARLSDGSIWSWGRNFQGESGDGTTTMRPGPVLALPPYVVTGVSFGGIPALSFGDLGTTASAVTPPHAAGPVDVVVTTETRTGGAGPTHTEAGGFTYLAAPAVPPAITSGAPPGAAVGEPYSHQVTASGTGPISFSMTGSLPPGLALDPATGVISGTPTAEGDYAFTVIASNVAGEDPAAYLIEVLAEAVPDPSDTETPATAPQSIPGETDLAYSGMSSSAPAAALLGAALAALGAGTWTLRTVLRRRAL